MDYECCRYLSFLMSHFTASDPLSSAAHAAIAYILSKHDITKQSDKTALHCDIYIIVHCRPE